MHNRYDYVPRPRKVKHVKFFSNPTLCHLETDINAFGDDHAEFKILGVRLMQTINSEYVATVTYLEDAKGVEYGECYDDTDEERDID